jgi:glucose/arabinose dehydrogenase
MHWTRNILFSPDGKWLYLSVGSETNRSVEQSPRASLMRVKTSDWSMKPFATGIRNPVGLTFRPGTEELWMTCVERDYMGDDLVPDFITQVKEGQFYGWPWYYIGKNRDPRIPTKGAPKTPVTIPDVLVTSHSVPLGMLFYTGSQFPEKYRGDLFVAMRGSTNRREMAGYQLIRIDFEKGVRKPGYSSFAEGWIPDRKSPNVYGRPVGLAQMQDGSMLVADEGAGMVWRISYSE